jgi:hypothetical protein
VIATLSPFTLLRLVPAVEAGAVAHLESTRHRLQSAARAPVRTGGNLALDLAGGSGGSAALGGSDVGSVGSGASRGGGSAIPMITGVAISSGSAPVAATGEQPAGGRTVGAEGTPGHRSRAGRDAGGGADAPRRPGGAEHDPPGGTGRAGG